MTLIVWGPYWAWNLLHNIDAWWRVPIISGTVFDTAAYLQWLGQTANGWDIGGHVRWYVWPLLGIAELFPNASISEWWLFSRWISITAALWVFAWAVRCWSGLDVVRSRFVAVAFWLSFVLALGMRPGVYSWYLPFGIFSMTVPLLVVRSLQSKRFVQAIAWTIAALASSFVYTWFFLVAFFFLASIWSVWLVLQSKKIFFATLVSTIAVLWLLLPSIATWLTHSESGMLLMDLQIKSGLGFTHLPQLTNSFFVIPVWILFFAVLSRILGHDSDSKKQDRLMLVQWAWIALLMTWLITPFTGVYLHNDHFRTPAVILSWISIAVTWSLMENNSVRATRFSKWILRGIFALSLLAILHGFLKPFVLYNDLEVIHFSHWFAVLMTALLGLGIRRFSAGRTWQTLLMIGALLIGGAYTVSIYEREFSELPNRLSRVPVVEWVRQNIPLQDSICSDPLQADLLATYTGRRIFPAGTTLYYREETADVLRRMQTYASGYDIAGSGNMEYISYVNHFGRSMICHQFPWNTKLLGAMGVSTERINEISGCPRSLIADLDHYSEAMGTQSEVESEAFRALCPWVIISADQRVFWHLPVGYVEMPINPDISVWRAPE